MGWIFILVIGGIAVWFFLARRNQGQGTAESAEQVLKNRYAKGEIDRENYERMLEDLRK